MSVNVQNLMSQVVHKINTSFPFYSEAWTDAGSPPPADSRPMSAMSQTSGGSRLYLYNAVNKKYLLTLFATKKINRSKTCV